MKAIFRKEVTEYLTSVRFMILVLLAGLASVLAFYSASHGIRLGTVDQFVFLRLFTTEAPNIPFAFLFSYINFVTLFFIPLVGISLGFDAINKERSSGTLSRVLSQPVYRDSVINGKFLAGIFTLALMLLISILLVSGYGMGLRLVSSLLGIAKPLALPPPMAEEIIRLFIYFIFAVIYGAFWMGMAMLFSIATRNTATSLLSSLGIWLFFSLGVLIIANAASDVPGAIAVLRLTPNLLFGDASAVLLQPLVRALGTPDAGLMGFIVPNAPLSIRQSIIVVWPHLTGLVSLTSVFFAGSYVAFMKQEIRST